MSEIQDNTVDVEIEETQAKAIAKALDAHSQRLSMTTLTRLEQSRALAVSRYQARASGQVNTDGTLSGWLASGAPAWLNPRLLGTALLCLMLVLGFAIMQNKNQQVENSDAFLLSAELPPEAFVDRGFEPWLNANPEL
jgi:hypothetical protein